ncbi:OmpA family protein [Novosphingobium sp.]|uniref:OmpA family protein n=1 Tax=Novosphingobium sp. TaxID=1874826 RepID=UPI0025F22B10|nr:OmpA family protein [Novosphingobium sp.]
MGTMSTRTTVLSLAALLALPASVSVSAQEPANNPAIIVNGELTPDMSAMTPGPELKGVITAKTTDRIKVTTADGTSTVVYVNDTTKIKGGSGLFGGKGNYTKASLLNGLPVTVKTMQAGPVLLASQVSFKGSDSKVATMIRNGTAQGFAEQTAATQALRSRMADIDNYNIKGTTNVYFDTAKSNLSPQAKAELCQAATQAEGMNNALLLVVGYTDSVGDEEYNQTLSEKRASSVVNYLQQYCKWKPYRVLTPTGMAESDPAADNSTEEGKAQNRRVAVNILVSKSVDGL